MPNLARRFLTIAVFWWALATWYGWDFHGQTMANGEPFDATAITAACDPQFLGEWFLVSRTDGKDGAIMQPRRQVVVQCTDTGPFERTAGGWRSLGPRRVDLSAGAFGRLGQLDAGIMWVEVERLDE